MVGMNTSERIKKISEKKIGKVSSFRSFPSARDKINELAVVPESLEKRWHKFSFSGFPKQDETNLGRFLAVSIRKLLDHSLRYSGQYLIGKCPKDFCSFSEISAHLRIFSQKSEFCICYF